MGRSRARRADGGRAPAAPPFVPVVSPAATEGIVFEPLTDRADEARRLFTYAGAWAPPPSTGELAWGAFVAGDAGRGLLGALILERRGASGMLHGPVVVGRDGDAPARPDPVEVAARLLSALLPQATGRGATTLFARPQGLDRVWVRFGFIPVPEADLPAAFRGRPGTGLFAWRGGTALWSTRRPQETESGVTPRPRRGRGSG